MTEKTKKTTREILAYGVAGVGLVSLISLALLGLAFCIHPYFQPILFYAGWGLVTICLGFLLGLMVAVEEKKK